MNLSEAIRIGSKSDPQCFGVFVHPCGGTCALGAALKGSGVEGAEHFDGLGGVEDIWPWLRSKADCPACGRSAGISNVIAEHLNDDHRWTRERIADWVETVEPEAKISTNINTIAVSGEDQFLATD